MCTLAAALILGGAASAQVSERVLYTFTPNSVNGGSPMSPLLQDSAGRLYGTASTGGRQISPCPCGVVFELIPGAAGAWTYHLLYEFQGMLKGDGKTPSGNLVMDSAGNLYGTTSQGGTVRICGENNGCGTVFKLTRNATGRWAESVLHSFGGAGDGSTPYSGLTIDGAGNLYGATTYTEINTGGGQIFELSPNSDGTWTESILHTFGVSPDGTAPISPVIFDGSGNMYGTTELGGTSNLGTVFELSPGAGGWTENILYSFTGGQDQGVVFAPVTFDSAGNLFGTTTSSGSQGGTVFELISSSDGTWSEKTLHTFGAGNDASRPAPGGLALDRAGNLYGTTNGGGTSGWGTVYRLRPQTNGTWTESVLYNFTDGADGALPYGVTLSKGPSLALFGSAWYGEIGTAGVVFEISK
jgi:uncharacterized repeat protein (TIGR03803 family)